jgi:hypothetical protein
MKKIVRLTESDLTRLVKRVIEESNEDSKISIGKERTTEDFLERIKNIGGGELGMKKLVDLQTLIDIATLDPAKKRKIMRAIDKQLEVINSQDWSKY